MVIEEESETSILKSYQTVPASLVSALQVTAVDSTSTMQSFGTSTQQPHQQQLPYGVQQTMHHAQGQMTSGLERVRVWLQHWIQNAADTLRVYVNQYPPLAAFIFTLLVLSAVPVSVFVIFGLITSAIFLSIALIGFSFVEGFILLTSGGVLMAILGGIGLCTTIGFAVISAIYLSYRGGCYLATNLWEAGGQIGGQMKEAAQRVGQSMQQNMPSQQQSAFGTTGTSAGYGSSGITGSSGAPSS